MRSVGTKTRSTKSAPGQMQHFPGDPLATVPEQGLGLCAQLLLNLFKRHSAALLKCDVKDRTYNIEKGGGGAKVTS